MSTLIDIRAGERRNTFAAFGALLGITAGHTLLETTRDALFLARMPASQLPWLYLVIVLVALGLAKLGKGSGGKAGVAVALALASAVTAGFWVLSASPSPWLLYALYVWSGVFASWVTVQLWTLLGRIHTMTQAKRLYGFIGSGAVLGAVLGALFARMAMGMFAPRTSLLVAAAIFLAAAAPCLALVVPAAKEEDDAARFIRSEERPRGTMATNVSLLWDNAFARRVLGIVFVSTITFTFADYLFKAQLAHHTKDAAELGATLASFYAVANAGSLLAQLFVAPWVFRSLGVQRALFFFPTALAAAAAAVVATAGSIGAVFALKGSDGVLRYSIHRTSTELLLVPVPDGTRERIKPIVDLLGSRGGQALASLGILFLVWADAGRPRVLGAVVLTLSLVWLGLVLTIRTLYLDVFRETLKSGGLSGTAELPELDLGALETIFAGLNSTRDPEVLASLELLAEQHRERLIPALILYHPGRAIVLRALELFTQQGRTDFVPIADRLDGHPDREVAAAALRARTKVSPDRALLDKRLASTCPQVSITALTLLLSHGWIDGDVADERIAQAVGSGAWEAVAELARAIADAPVPGPADERFDALLLSIVEKVARRSLAAGATPMDARGFEDSPEVRVTLETARAMGIRKNPRFLPVLVGMLRRHELRSAAREAIRGIPGALEALDLAFSAPAISREVKMQIPRAMTVFDPLEASRLLGRQLRTQEDGTVRYKILRALVKLRRQAPEIALDESALTSVAEATLDHAAELRRWGATLAAPPRDADGVNAAHHLLAELVHDKLLHATQRTFLLLELIHREDFDGVWRGLRSDDAKARASGLELVENIVKPPLRSRVLALVGDRRAPDAAMDYEEAIREILVRGSSTMRALAEYRAQELGLDVTALKRPSLEPSVLAASLGKLRAVKELLEPPPAARGSHAPA